MSKVEPRRKNIKQKKLQAKQGNQELQVANWLTTILEKLLLTVAELNKHAKLHGINHLVNQKHHPLERLLWFTLVIAAFYGVFYIGNNQMKRYRANPTVISLERGIFIAP